MAPLKGPHNERYTDFYDDWSNTQLQQLEELERALNSNMSESEIKALVDKAKMHYDYYYGAKDNAAKQNVLQVMTPAWKTPLETAFMWTGGWRPTMVFQLAYALAGQLVEAELSDLLSGVDSPSLASLSARQLEKINEMQVKVQKQEDDISHRMAVLQQGMADQPFVGITQTLAASEDDKMEAAVDSKLKDLESLLEEADNLRRETLHNMLDTLTPVQAAQYLVAAAQLQVAFRKIGAVKNGSSGD
ncbi:hypothetical protein SELMODRAFT_181239 [Selaginella moellendorffii]|uniref:DOG1 domain-containing protein n=1 Tax=Selaginella moellendorffii TaxID=88036 RepID=D8SN43_SELML|nr:protein DOG1-like 3 [Selaginella moellendorffii]EFJ13997.1 hypothetical protein SELMODRAFT_181239 [Selaginella moellendorffii]|eukprot:XP_024545793.1 protein DOG1-like 3 [Selaginella moellendorffii]